MQWWVLRGLGELQWVQNRRGGGGFWVGKDALLVLLLGGGDVGCFVVIGTTGPG